MEASELRVGNYIRNDVQGINFQVNSVVIHRLCFGDSEGYAPIELTEEILLKCGFEEKNSILEKDGIRLFKIRDLYFRGNFPIKADVRYLHQLQNLYFALTGEELNVQL